MDNTKISFEQRMQVVGNISQLVLMIAPEDNPSDQAMLVAKIELELIEKMGQDHITGVANRILDELYPQKEALEIASQEESPHWAIIGRISTLAGIDKSVILRTFEKEGFTLQIPDTARQQHPGTTNPTTPAVMHSLTNELGVQTNKPSSSA